MGINKHEFLKYVIQPTLKQLGTDSEAAETLLLATACCQSGMGHHLNQSGAIGVYGISEELHREVWDKYLAFDCDLASNVRGMASQHEFPKEPHCELATNLRYATAIAWMVYQYRNVTIPDNSDTDALAQCWQQGFLNRPISIKEQETIIACCQSLKTEMQPIAA